MGISTPESQKLGATICRRFNEKWHGDGDLISKVHTAVWDNDLEKLIEIIDARMTIIDNLEVENYDLNRELKSLRKLIAQKDDEIEQLKQGLNINHTPAFRDDLDVDKMYTLYKIHKSYSKVADLMNCDRGTVRNRLRKAGLI